MRNSVAVCVPTSAFTLIMSASLSASDAGGTPSKRGVLTLNGLSWCWTPSRCHQTIFQHDGEFFHHLLVLSSIASRSIIVGNPEESMGSLTGANFCFWLKVDIQPPKIEVCSTPKSGHSAAHAGLPLLTQNRPTGDEVREHHAYRNSVVCVPSHLLAKRRPVNARTVALIDGITNLETGI